MGQPEDKEGADSARPSIVVRNSQRKIRLDARRLNDFACRALRACSGIPGRRRFPGEISVIIVSDRTMAELHERFMGVAGPTDVITFQHGDIVIRAETAKRQAPDYEASLVQEVQLYIIHGLLHLRGYDDQTAKGSTEMRRRQRSILRRLTAEGRRLPV